MGGSMGNTLQYFEQATAKDSNYALAYAGAADILLAMDFQSNGTVISRVEAGGAGMAAFSAKSTADTIVYGSGFKRRPVAC
jgi:hypothetical protein